MKIGVLDSGVGGTTVVEALIKKGIKGDYFYYGDLIHSPYGEKKPDELWEIIKPIVHFLESKTDILILACNTVNALLLEKIKKEIQIPIYEIVQSGVELASKKTINGNILILSTSGTAKSGIYERQLKKKRNVEKVKTIACPKLVPLIENMAKSEMIERAIFEYTQQIPYEYDTVLLGCTHYPLIKKEIKKRIPNSRVCLIDPAEELAIQISKIPKIKENKEENIFFLTKESDLFFQRVKTLFKKEKLENLVHIVYTTDIGLQKIF